MTQAETAQHLLLSTIPWLATEGSLVWEAALDVDDDIGTESKCTLLHVKSSVDAQVSYLIKRSIQGNASTQREYHLYNLIDRQSSPSPLPTISGIARIPKCLFSSNKNGTVTLVLEFLGRPDWVKADLEVNQCTHRQAVSAVEILGHMHKRFSGDVLLQPELDWLTDTRFDFGACTMQNLLVRIWHGHDSKSDQVRSVVHELPKDIKIIVDWMVAGGCVECHDRLSQPPLALNHGDYHLNNLRFSAEHLSPAVAVFDWGGVHKARGIKDFGYFLLLSLSPEDRRQHQQELLLRYLEARGDAEVSVVAESWEDLKAAAVTVLFMMLLLHFTHHDDSSTVHRKMITCITGQVVEAIVDWKVIEITAQ